MAAVTTAAPAATAMAEASAAVLTGRAGTGGPVLHARLCAGVVAASGGVHVWLALQNEHGACLGALMMVLAAVCMPCAVHIWQDSHVAALQRVMGCALFMVALHGLILVSGTARGHAHHNTYGDLESVADRPGNLLAVIGLELITALFASTLVARLRANQRAAHHPLH
ncbi:hypothetical protein [Arthrobacter sp.]|uniref:hypothetical protein n=1 Tax=Arthrobacter sp. TaxID=1667 RepID=UPI002811F60A|nr:hypothetical protein [Arthrobacter sp.]